MKVLRLAVLFLLVVPLILPSAPGQDVPGKPKAKPEAELTPPPDAQEVPAAKPAYDYMSTFLSRSTRPLGLKEDILAKKLLQQRATKWAERAGLRHIFN